MRKITPHLWFDREAKEAAELYTATFPDSRITNVTSIPGTPSGDADIVSFELFGQPFMAISAGPEFKFTPAISFLVSCETKEEVDEYWNALSEGGAVLMPLGSYPFSEWYGWTTDKYGLSWQIGHAGSWGLGQRITPTLMFTGDVCGKAEEAMNFYKSVFDDAEVGNVMRYGPGEEPDTEGSVRHAGFTLEGWKFSAMDSALAHEFGFNEAISFIVDCKDQAEMDRYFDALTAVPESEQCGWLKDKFGLSWQITPSRMDEMLAQGTPEQVARVTEAFLPMRRLDLAELEKAYQGS